MIPSRDELRRLIDYDPSTGIATWKPRERNEFNQRRAHLNWQQKKAGKRVGKEKEYTGGYRAVRACVLGRVHFLHRLIWVYMTGDKPPRHIDHINRDATDNRWENLRDGSKVNRYNLSLYANNKSGVCGVHWDGQHNRWKAAVTHAKVVHRLGLFKELGDAKRAVAQFRSRHGGFSEGHGAPRASSI